MATEEPRWEVNDEEGTPSVPDRDGGWTDGDGRYWRHRGSGRKAAKRFERLARSPQVRIVHVYGPDSPRDIPASERNQFWDRVRPYLDYPDGQNPEGMDAFYVAEFKDSEGNSLLMVTESC
ncbi:hypothetical protein GCM10028777_02270 [Angustibacter speluncae]